MKVHHFPPAPNPTKLNVYLAEKGLEIPHETVNLAGAPAHAGKLAEMRAALRAVAQSGVAVAPSLLGSGVAFSQHPAPGEALHEGQACRVEFQPLL